MKRYIVTEEELKELYRSACSVGCGADDSTDRAANAIEATRSRPCLFYSDAHDFDGKLLGSLWASAKEELPK